MGTFGASFFQSLWQSLVQTLGSLVTKRLFNSHIDISRLEWEPTVSHIRHHLLFHALVQPAILNLWEYLWFSFCILMWTPRYIYAVYTWIAAGWEKTVFFSVGPAGVQIDTPPKGKGGKRYADAHSAANTSQVFVMSKNIILSRQRPLRFQWTSRKFFYFCSRAV